jgi:tRNA/rRNA methyltransferase
MEEWNRSGVHCLPYSLSLFFLAMLPSPPRIILVEPAGPLNVGSAARVMKNFGLGQLILVNPQCDRFCDDALKMAVHARDVLDQAQVVATLPEALAGVQRAIATTGLSPRDKTPLESPRQVLPWLLPARLASGLEASAPESAPEVGAIIFGREERGLTSDELHYAQRRLQIPSHPGYPSLNLAQAVAVCCYEWSLLANAVARSGDPVNVRADAADAQANVQAGVQADVQAGVQADVRAVARLGAIVAPTILAPTIVTPTTDRSAQTIDDASRLSRIDPPASLQDLDGYYRHLEAVLLKIGYLFPHTAASRMKRFRRLYNRAQPSSPEIHQLRGILSQVEWLLGQIPAMSSSGSIQNLGAESSCDLGAEPSK